MKLAQRKSDGVLFEPSHPGNNIHAWWLVWKDIQEKGYYFRELKESKSRLWSILGYKCFSRTGVIWLPAAIDFDVVYIKARIRR